MSPERRVSWPTSSRPPPPEQLRRRGAAEGDRPAVGLQVDVGDAPDAVRAEQPGHGGDPVRRMRSRRRATPMATAMVATGAGAETSTPDSSHRSRAPPRPGPGPRCGVDRRHPPHACREPAGPPRHAASMVDGSSASRPGWDPAKVTRTVGVGQRVLPRPARAPCEPDAHLPGPRADVRLDGHLAAGPCRVRHQADVRPAGRPPRSRRASSVEPADVEWLGRDRTTARSTAGGLAAHRQRSGGRPRTPLTPIARRRARR